MPRVGRRSRPAKGHDALVPRDFGIDDWERRATLDDFCEENPLEAIGG